MPAELIILGNPKGRTKRRELLRNAIAKARGRAARLARIGKRNPAEMVILGANPASKVSAKSAELYENFHGAVPKELLEVNELQDMPREVVVLGNLESMFVDAPRGEMKIDFSSDGVRVASNASGTQLYFVAGNQNLDATLDQFDAKGKSPARLGAAREIRYASRKAMDGGNLNYYKHEFGEEDGARPVLWYDARIKRIYLVGGNYRIEAPGIIN